MAVVNDVSAFKIHISTLAPLDLQPLLASLPVFPKICEYYQVDKHRHHQRYLAAVPLTTSTLTHCCSVDD